MRLLHDPAICFMCGERFALTDDVEQLDSEPAEIGPLVHVWCKENPHHPDSYNPRTIIQAP